MQRVGPFSGYFESFRFPELTEDKVMKAAFSALVGVALFFSFSYPIALPASIVVALIVYQIDFSSTERGRGYSSVPVYTSTPVPTLRIPLTSDRYLDTPLTPRGTPPSMQDRMRMDPPPALDEGRGVGLRRHSSQPALSNTSVGRIVVNGGHEGLPPLKQTEEHIPVGRRLARRIRD